MVKKLFIVTFSLLLTSCSNNGLSLYVSKERTAHYRTFARITDAEDTDKVHFKVMKRERQVMAEKELYSDDEGTSWSVAGGKHKDKDWSAGLVLRYAY
ncbi:MAG: hypothetical protein P8P30_04215 [Rickettsiales bacterium]|nr:hypothetical protein [Rickettsiales bacterium]